MTTETPIAKWYRFTRDNTSMSEDLRFFCTQCSNTIVELRAKRWKGEDVQTEFDVCIAEFQQKLFKHYTRWNGLKISRMEEFQQMISSFPAEKAELCSSSQWRKWGLWKLFEVEKEIEYIVNEMKEGFLWEEPKIPEQKRNT